MSNPKRIRFLRWLAVARQGPVFLVGETLYAISRMYLLFLDLIKMVDVNDFGRYVSKNLSKRFIALSGIVTLFAVIGQYTKMIVLNEKMDSGFTENLWSNLVANFIFFGIPGGILLLLTQLFSFFNRSNYFTAQANYLNLLELYKRTPAHLNKIIGKLWSYVYQSEFEIYAGDESHACQCDEVMEIQRQKSVEESMLIAEIVHHAWARGGAADAATPASTDEKAGPAPLRARIKYERYLEQAYAEGYFTGNPWERMTVRERCAAVRRIIQEEMVEEITRRNLRFCERGFKQNAAWSLSYPSHLNLKHRKTGIDLKLVEDWLDGAFFDLTDTKLIEQYIAEATIKSVKLQARVPVVLFIMIQGIRIFMQRIWTYMVFGITSKRLGRYLNHLNNKYVREESEMFDRDYFKAEAFFWPTPAYDREIIDEIGEESLTRLKVLRQRWLFLTLGRLKRPRVKKGRTRESIRRKLERNTKKAVRNATRLIHRMFAGNVYNIHELRLHYDPDYVIQVATRGMPEFERMGLNEHYVKRQRPRVRRLHRKVLRFQKFLIDLLEPKAAKAWGLKCRIDQEAMRAIRVYYHINEKGLRRLVDQEVRSGPDSARRKKIYEIIEEVAAGKKTCSRKVRQLKTFETMAIHHLKTYVNTIAHLYEILRETFQEELEARMERKTQ